VFHPTTLVNFRQRLLDHHLSRSGSQALLAALSVTALTGTSVNARIRGTSQFIGQNFNR